MLGKDDSPLCIVITSAKVQFSLALHNNKHIKKLNEHFLLSWKSDFYAFSF